MPADEAELAVVGARQLHFDLHLNVAGQADVGEEGVGRVAVPVCRAADQQALEGQVKQLHIPAVRALQQLGGGIEGNALKAPTLVSGVTHYQTPHRVLFTIAKAQPRRRQ